MKIQNTDSRDNNGSYEVIIICKNEKEFSDAYQKITAAAFITDSMEELEINVFTDNTDYATKADFIKDIRKIAKK